MNARILTLLIAFAASPAQAGNAEPEANPRSGAPTEWGEALDLDLLFGQVLIDRLEASRTNDQNGYVWDAQAWYGGDFNKIWVKTEGEGIQGQAPEAGDVEVLYSRNVAAFWDLQAGIRYDARPKPERAALALGVQGLAPYLFEVDATAYLREGGLLSASFQAEYDLLLTQRVVLQPRIEFSLQSEDDLPTGTGAGLTSSALGIRLRYEIRREFAPYIGFSWGQAYGETATLRRAAGEATSSNALVVGIRAWF